MRSFFSLLLVSILASVPSVVANCPRFNLGATSCSSGAFTGSSLSSSCDDNTISVSGTVSSSGFSNKAKVVLQPCVMGMYCNKNWKQSAGKICDLVENTNGDDCGSAGTYSVNEEFEVPESALTSSFLMGAITVKVLVGGEESCTQKGSAKNSSGYMMVGVSALALGGLGVMLARRKRKKPLLVLEGGGHNFVEMQDQSQRPGAWV